MLNLSEAAWEIIEQNEISADEIIQALNNGFNVIISPSFGLVATACSVSLTEKIIKDTDFSVIYCDTGKVSF